MTEESAFRVLRRSRKIPESGDVFAMLLPDDLYLFGRVVASDVEIPPLTIPIMLIYIYKTRSDAKAVPDRTILKPANLLLPPIMINTLPWRKGYFETFAHWALARDEILRQHCFWDSLRKRFVDEHQNQLPGRIEPCGTYGLAGYGAVESELAPILGFDLRPERPSR